MHGRVQGEGGRAADGIAFLVFVGDERDRTGKDPGIAPETLRRWRDSADATVAAESKQSAEEAMAELERLWAENAQLRQTNEILTTASAFFRGQTRPDTALMVAYVDEHKGRFGVGPICRVLSESLDCRFPAPRGYRMFKKHVPSAACGFVTRRRPATSSKIRSDFFMAVYGYRKVRTQLIAQDWDPGGMGPVTFCWTCH